MRVHSTLVPLALAVCTAFAAAPASAQQMAAQRFRAAGSEDGILGVRGADPRRPLHPYVALWAHYGLDPLIVADAV